MKKVSGIAVRHSKYCASHDGDACSCRPTYQARVTHGRNSKVVSKSFRTLAEARAWKTKTKAAAYARSLPGYGASRTVAVAAAEMFDGMHQGTVRNRAGVPYKLSVIRKYELDMARLILPELGHVRLGELRRRDVQRVVEGLVSAGAAPATVKNALMGLRVLFRLALRDEDVAVSPMVGLELPAVRSRRDRVASPAEATALIEALSERDRALWGMAFYAGLRLGEIGALRWEDVDLDEHLIHVRRSYDHWNQRMQEPKTRAGTRRVPMLAGLRVLLLRHRLLTGRASGLVFGVSASKAFTPSAVRNRSVKAWDVAGLRPITLHECRHTYASLLIAGGINAKAISTFLGHSSIQTTFDLYGHLMPGSEAEARQIMDAYLARFASPQ